MTAMHDTWPPQPSLERQVSAHITHLLAPNPHMWTWEGTNSYVIGSDRSRRCVIVDPGTKDPGHLRAVLEAVTRRAWTVEAVVVTHLHVDHLDGAAELAETTGSLVHSRGLHPDHVGLADGQVLALGDVEVEVMATPGHTEDSTAFAVPCDRKIISGDTVLNRRSSGLEGKLSDFLATAEQLRDRVTATGASLLPGHGPELRDAAPVIDRLLKVRTAQADAAQAAIRRGVTRPAELVDELFPGLPGERRPAAEQLATALFAHAAQGLADPS